MTIATIALLGVGAVAVLGLLLGPIGLLFGLPLIGVLAILGLGGIFTI